MTDIVYELLHGARERLCRVQSLVVDRRLIDDLSDALAVIDRVGVMECPQQWSKYDEPTIGDGS